MADASLILDTFTFKEDVERPDQEILRVGGRTRGIVGLILKVLGLGTHSMIVVTRREATFQFTNLGGISYVVCPLDTVRCSLSGVHKPLWALVASGMTLVFGFIALLLDSLGLDFLSDLIASLGLGGGLGNLAILSILASIGFFIFYFFTKNLILTFSTGNIGHMRGLGFELTMTNGRSIGVDMLLKVVKQLNAHIVDVKYNGVEVDPNYIPPDNHVYESSLQSNLPTDDNALADLIDSLDYDDDEADSITTQIHTANAEDDKSSKPLPSPSHESVTEADPLVQGKELYEKAKVIFAAGDYKQVIIMLEDVKKLNPTLAKKADRAINECKNRLNQR